MTAALGCVSCNNFQFSIKFIFSPEVFYKVAHVPLQTYIPHSLICPGIMLRVGAVCAYIKDETECTIFTDSFQSLPSQFVLGILKLYAYIDNYV